MKSRSLSAVEMALTVSIPHYYLYGETNPVSELEFLHIETIAARGKLHALVAGAALVQKELGAS